MPHTVLCTLCSSFFIHTSIHLHVQNSLEMQRFPASYVEGPLHVGQLRKAMVITSQPALYTSVHIYPFLLSLALSLSPFLFVSVSRSPSLSLYLVSIYYIIIIITSTYSIALFIRDLYQSALEYGCK